MWVKGSRPDPALAALDPCPLFPPIPGMTVTDCSSYALCQEPTRASRQSIIGIIHLRMRKLWIAERTLRPYQAVHFRKDFVHRGILCGESD
jgi:hypothetical protein